MLTIEKDTEFDATLEDDEQCKKRLEAMIGKPFESLEEIKSEIYSTPLTGLGKIYIPDHPDVKINSLPFAIEKLPLQYYNEFIVNSLRTIATIKTIH